MWTAVAKDNVGAVRRALWPATAGSPDGDGEDGGAGVDGGVEEAATAHRLRSVMGADAPPPRDARGLLLAAVASGSAPVVGALLEAGHLAGGPFLPSLSKALWATVDADAPAVATELLAKADCAWPGSDAADVALSRTVRPIGEEGGDAGGGGGGGGATATDEPGANTCHPPLDWRSPLMAAAEAGREQLVRALLHSYVVRRRTEALLSPRGESALTLALERGRSGEAVALALLRHGESDRRFKDAFSGAARLDGAGVLHLACAAGLKRVVSVLVTRRPADDPVRRMVPINVTDSAGRTALHVAAAAGHTGVVALLKKHGGGNDYMEALLAATRDADGHTPLQAAAAGGHVATLTVLLEFSDYSVYGSNVVNLRRGACLVALGAGQHAAANLLAAEVAAALLREGSHLSHPRATLLGSAAGAGQTAVVAALLHPSSHPRVERLPSGAAAALAAAVASEGDAGGRAPRPGQYDKAPLEEAVRGGHLATVVQLLDAGAPLGRDGGASFLHTAVRVGASDLVAELLRRGVPVNAVCGTEAKTPLHVATRYGRADAAAVLLADPATCVTAYDEKEWTPLHSAALRGDANFFRALARYVRGAQLSSNYDRRQNRRDVHLPCLEPRYDPEVLDWTNGQQLTPLHMDGSMGNQQPSLR